MRERLEEIAASAAAVTCFANWRMSGLRIGQAGLEQALSWEIGRAIFCSLDPLDAATHVCVEAKLKDFAPGLASRGGLGAERIDVAIVTKGTIRAAFESKRNYRPAIFQDDADRLAKIAAFARDRGDDDPSLFLVGVYEFREKRRRRVEEVAEHTACALTKRAEGGSLPYAVEVAQIHLAGKGEVGATHGICWSISVPN